jgi:dihydrolipoamide dehydrogenase
MRTNVPHIFAIGDVVGQPMLAHKATHEGKLAAEVAARRETRVGGAVDPVGRLHRSGNRLGRRHRNRGEAKGIAGRRREIPWAAPGARSASAAPRASPSWCSTRPRIASSAAASSACTPAT